VKEALFTTEDINRSSLMNLS